MGKGRQRPLSSDLYSLARTSRDIEVLASGNPKRIGRRIKNKVLGRLLGGFWRFLWR